MKKFISVMVLLILSVAKGYAQTATTTSVGSSNLSVAVGVSVTFTATVVSSLATGTVSFYDGATVINTATLSGGTATYTTSALAAGSHSIKAVYAGNGTYATSTSPTITETVTAPQAAAPAFSIASKTYTSSQTLTITDSTSGSTIHYGTSTDSTVCSPSTTYTGSITVASAEHVCAYATATSYTQSITVDKDYGYNSPPPPPPAPVITTGGSFSTSEAVTITDASTDSTIFYTTDGTAADATAPNTCTSPCTFTVSATTTVNAIAQLIGVNIVNETGTNEYWKAPDTSTDIGGGGAAPISAANPTSSTNGASSGDNGLVSGANCDLSANCMDFFVTPATGGNNILWAKSTSVPNSVCNYCEYMKADHYIKYTGTAQSWEDDDYIWSLDNFQGSGQICTGHGSGGVAACPNGKADLDIAGNTGSPTGGWIATGIGLTITENVWHHVIKMEHWSFATLTSKPCTDKNGNAQGCIYWDKEIWDGTPYNLQASGMCGMSAGCHVAVEACGCFGDNIVADQYQTDTSESTSSESTQTVDSANIMALYEPSTAATPQTFTLSGTLITTTTNLTGGPSSIYFGTNVLLTGTVAPSSTGSIAFYDGTSLLSTQTMSGSVASYTVTSPTPGNHTYTAEYLGSSTDAASNSAGVTVAVSQDTQTITFPGLSATTTATSSEPLTATASSGLTVTYTVVSGPGTISGSNVLITGAGTITVQAAQSGNADYLAASPVTQSFVVSAASTGLQPCAKLWGPLAITGTAGITCQ
jgi:hypothetical protein